MFCTKIKFFFAGVVGTTVLETGDFRVDSTSDV